jgi:hypothetical protein
MTREFVERGLVVNRRVEEYDGTTAVTRSTHLARRRSSSCGGRPSAG